MAQSGDTGSVDLADYSLATILQAAHQVRAEAIKDMNDQVAIPNDHTIASVFTLLHHQPDGKVIAAIPCGLSFKGLSIERVV